MLLCSPSFRAAWSILPVTVTLLLPMLFVGCRGESPSDESAKTQNETADATADGKATPGKLGETQIGGTQAGSTPIGQALYARHCAGCHGEQGDGLGIAATYLYPKPRDFGSSFRIVSSAGRNPSRDDIHAVLLRGMPGSSMPPWAHLSQSDRDLLVDEVFRLRHEALGRLFVQQWIEDGEDPDDIDEDEKADFVASRMDPGEPLAIPEIPEPDEGSIARGKETFFKLGCHSCHGETGKGDGQQQMVNIEGFPTRPRDFTLGIFKGNNDPASLYLRVAIGMPGGSMPATSQATPEEAVDLTQFILSLSTETQREAAILRRATISAIRVAAVADLSDDGAWSNISSTRLPMTPLWWRDDADPDLQVQAAHDGQTLVLRLTWQDETQDLHAVTSGHFEDAAAVELYRGENEPFLGMGGPGSPIDAWFWDADRQSATDVEDRYPNAVVDIYPFHETTVDTAEGQRPGAETASQPDVSLPAVASANPIVPTDDESRSGGSALTAGGPQTVTFRIPKNQSVDARGNWADGRWSVVMKRALQPDAPEGGVSLTPGERVSVAFAVFDGAKNDRDGQKMITAWNDLTLED